MKRTSLIVLPNRPFYYRPTRRELLIDAIVLCAVAAVLGEIVGALIWG